MILIVDDDHAVLHSLELLLKQAGFTTASAADPQAALTHLDAPDLELVLQDMNFSRQTTGEEGLELLTAIKAHRPAVPVILITAWGSIELAVRGMQSGAADFVTKPWQNELTDIIKSVPDLPSRADLPEPLVPVTTQCWLSSSCQLISSS